MGGALACFWCMALHQFFPDTHRWRCKSHLKNQDMNRNIFLLMDVFCWLLLGWKHIDIGNICNMTICIKLANYRLPFRYCTVNQRLEDDISWDKGWQTFPKITKLWVKFLFLGLPLP